MSFSNPNNLCLIDFEYASWSWRELDIANYVNETICDNNFPEGCGIGYIFENQMEIDEIEYLVKEYLKVLYDNYLTEKTMS